MRALEPSVLNEKLMESVRAGDPIGILSHLAWGADVNAITDELTPLLRAVCSGNQLIVDQLYLNGAQLMKPSKKGWTALHVAAETGDCEMVDLLLLRGGRDMVFAQDEKGITPADRARLAHPRQEFVGRDSEPGAPSDDDEVPPAPDIPPPGLEIDDDEGLLLPSPPAIPSTLPFIPVKPGERDIVELLQNLFDSETKRRTKKLEQEIREESERAAEQAELEAAQLEEAKNSTSAKWKGIGAKLKSEFAAGTKKGLATVGAKMGKTKANLATKYRSPAGPPTPGGMFRAENHDSDT